MNQIFKFVNNLNSGQRAVIVAGFTILFLFLMGLLIYSNIKAKDEELNYTIAANLTKSQVMLASNELDAASIPYSVVGSGNNLTLKTNKENINIAKIKLVTSDAATNKHTGWEIFDKSSLGTTNFENQVKFLRALEGELARSLESISGILSANVKIAIPKESVFVHQKLEPTASAVLNLREGVALSQRQIEGIKNFIASSIPKLKPENIKLINQNGSLLQTNPEDIENLKYIEHEKYKAKLEKDYEKKIKELMLPFLGDQRVVAKVSIELDFVKQEISQEIYEPEGTIRSQQTTEVTTKSNSEEPKNAGAPGADSNIQDPAKKGMKKTNSSKEEAKNTTNYEISKKVINQKDNRYAGISKITAAVTFDSAVLEKVENKEEFISNLNSIVKVAIGYQEKRGDSVTVKAFKFIGLEPFGTEPKKNVEDDGSIGLYSTESILKEYGSYLQYIVAMVLLFMFYKKFIAENAIVLDGEIGADGKPVSGSGAKGSAAEMDEFLDEFDAKAEQNKLKAKVKSQILSNIDNLTVEEAAKYEVLIEQIENSVVNNPEEIAKMIEMLLNEGDEKFKPQ